MQLSDNIFYAVKLQHLIGLSEHMKKSTNENALIKSASNNTNVIDNKNLYKYEPAG